MFEKYTERARQVIVLAQEEARTLKHNYIGTEHILLGLLREQDGLGARVLESFEITTERARAQVVRIVGSGEEATSGQIPFTPRAKKVLELSLHEALRLGHNYIGTEHILLGLVRENDGVAVHILLDFDADSEKVRNEVIRMLSGPASQIRSAFRPAVAEFDSAWLGGLASALGEFGPEVRRRLERSPDSGDLLLVLACAAETRAAAALRALGVDLDALAGAVEQARAQASPSEDELTRQLGDVRRDKERAARSEAYETAAQLRDEEHELKRALGRAAVSPEVIEEIRARLGLASSD